MPAPYGNVDGTPVDSTESSEPSLASRNKQSSSRRYITICLLAGVAGIAAAILALELFVAHRLPDLTSERLAAAQSLWSSVGPDNYDLDLEILGERPGAVHVEVRGDVATNVSIDGREPSPWTRDTWTVRGQFETLERELVLAEDPAHQMEAKSGTSLRLRCEFDPKYGFPREYQRTVYGDGPDVYWRVTGLVVR